MRGKGDGGGRGAVVGPGAGPGGGRGSRKNYKNGEASATDGIGGRPSVADTAT